MKTSKKTYLAGILTGVVVVVAAWFMFGKAFSIYNVYGKGELLTDKKIEAIYKVLDTYYVDEYDKQAALEGMYKGLVEGVGDPYTAYMDAATLKSFMEDTEGAYSGIGVVISVDQEAGRVVVVSPFENSPGDKAGILPGDYFIEIDGKEITAGDFENVSKMTKGVPGTSVNLKVYRSSEDKTIEYDIVREDIIFETVAHKMLDEQVGYLRIAQFDRVTLDQFKRAYEDLKTGGMKAMVLDLRNNPGGLLDVVVDITDMLAPEGIITYTEDKQKNREVHNSDAEMIEVPLTVLVNGNSASASEILSGAIKDLNVGKLVGTQTYGKGLVQSLFTLPDGSGVKVTISRYYTPSGVCINGIGITPDYVVEMDAEDSYRISRLPLEEDLQLLKAIEVLKSQMN